MGEPINHDLIRKLEQDFQDNQALYQAQPPLVQRFLEAQARQLAEALAQHVPQVRFTLPDRVSLASQAGSETKPVAIPAEVREQMAGGLIDRLTRTDLRAALRERLAELEGASDSGISAGARLIRFALANYMVHSMLPAGRSVKYRAASGEEIPSIPVGNLEPESAIMAGSDAVVEEGRKEAGRGELQVPYVPAARRFYLPQWVPFDDDQLLVGSPGEAVAHVASMQNFLGILHTAVGLAPYMVADEEYQRKRYGMLGQLVNQGRALARYQTGEIIHSIQRRAAAQDLNRGLSLSLPYFDDQSLSIRTLDFEIIPAGRIMFIPAFVVRAVREEQAKVMQDTRLSPSTRKHLLSELKTLEKAFISK